MDVLEDVEGCISCIPANDYYTWLKTLTGIKSVLGDTDEALGAARQWSMTSDKYDEKVFLKKWNGIKADFGKGFLFSIGCEYGYKNSRYRPVYKDGQRKKYSSKLKAKASPPTITETERLALMLDLYESFDDYSPQRYLEHKQISHLVDNKISSQLRIFKKGKFKNLIIPARCIQTNRMTALQSIFAFPTPCPKTGINRFQKAFLPHSEYSGAWFLFGDLAKSFHSTILLFESWIDALVSFKSMNERIACVCAFSQASIPSACKIISSVYPEANVIVFCDKGGKVEADNAMVYESPSFNDHCKDAHDIWIRNPDSFKNELRKLVCGESMKHLS